MKVKVNDAEKDGIEEILSGEYLVVDLCHLIRDRKTWDKVTDMFFDSLYNAPGDTENNWLLLDGQLVFMWCTSDGDGAYPVYLNGKEIGKAPVDSGTLAFVPMSLVRKLIPAERRSDGNLLSLKVLLDRVEPSLVSGDVTAGVVEVYTSPDDPYVKAEEDREIRARNYDDDDKDDDGLREFDGWEREDIP